MIKGIGVDIVDIERFRGILDRWGDRFLVRIFTERERGECLGSPDPVPHLAVRFAAKEAFSKALGTGFGKTVFPRSIEVTRKGVDAPRLILHDGARLKMEEMRATRTFLSLSHEGEMGIALVILEGDEVK